LRRENTFYSPEEKEKEKEKDKDKADSLTS